MALINYAVILWFVTSVAKKSNNMKNVCSLRFSTATSMKIVAFWDVAHVVW
jgi:hypothetical protein